MSFQYILIEATFIIYKGDPLDFHHDSELQGRWYNIQKEKRKCFLDFGLWTEDLLAQNQRWCGCGAGVEISWLAC